jgi:type IV pilus assembly protein PilC
MRSGVRLTDAIAITADTTNNLVYKDAAERMAMAIVRGEAMSKVLEKEKKLFPDMLSHMVMIGEKTGNLSTTLTYLAELYEGEVEELTKSLSSSIEPVLMIVMGILVGLIAVSVITPIYSITQHLQPK